MSTPEASSFACGIARILFNNSGTVLRSKRSIGSNSVSETVLEAPIGRAEEGAWESAASDQE